MSYSKLKREELERLLEIFIESKDWNEVSKIQYTIECLPPEPKKILFDVWFLCHLERDFVNFIVSTPIEILTYELILAEEILNELGKK